MKWFLVGVVVGCTAACDLLQSWEMKRHKRLAAPVLARWPILVSVVFMAISFFAFLDLLQREELSFAVPATAASLALETLLACMILKEHVQPRRWLGALLVALGVALVAQT